MKTFLPVFDSCSEKDGQGILKGTLERLSEGAYLFQGALVGADALDEGDGEGVELVRLVSLVDDGEGDAEVEDLEVPHLLGQRDDLGQEVDAEAERVAPAPDPGPLGIDGEDPAGNAQVPLLHFPSPVLKDLLRVELEPETIPVRLQLLALDVILPALA